MFVDTLCAFSTSVSSPAKLPGAKNGKSDPTFLGIVFMAFICAVLPLDISQLMFAILGAVLYAALQKSDTCAFKKKPLSAKAVTNTTAFSTNARDTKPKAFTVRAPTNAAPRTKPAPEVIPEVRAPSVQPIVAPTFQSDSWDGEIQELLFQITPTAEAESIVRQLAQMIRRTMQPMLPEIEVTGFANGNLTFGKAFGVAVPEVDIVANISPQVLYNRLHGRNATGAPAELDEKKLQKSAIRTCTDRLVSAGGFKFRRSAFRGSEPKVTLLAPASLGLFSDSIPIDFSVNVVTPMYNAALLMDCKKVDSRAKELILLVRRWAKDRGICHAAKGHLSPYVWGILTIYFLQVGVKEEDALLPALQHFQLSAELSKQQQASQEQKSKPSLTSDPTKSAAVLFKEFMHFYQAEFDWSNEAISIRAAERAPPSLELPLHIIDSDVPRGHSIVGPSIEDPFNGTQNLGNGMTSVSLARLKEELLRAEHFCLRSASLSELLEPWVPTETEEAAAGDKGETVVESSKQAGAMLTNLKSSETPPWRRR